MASALIANGISYAGGGLIGGGGGRPAEHTAGVLRPAGLAGQWGAALLKAWQTRRGGGFGAAWGPVVVNRQIDAMTSALHTATTLAGAVSRRPRSTRSTPRAGGPRQAEADRAHPMSGTPSGPGGDVAPDPATPPWPPGSRRPGNTRSLQPSVKKWKSQMAGQEKTIAGISKMLGFSAAAAGRHQRGDGAGGEDHRRSNLPPAKHTYGGDAGVVVNDIGAFLASNAVGPFGKARGGLVRSFDSGGVLSPGMNPRGTAPGRTSSPSRPAAARG